MKEEEIKHQIENVERIEEAGKPKAGLTLSVQDEQQSKELEKAVAEQENKLGDNNDNTAKLETKALSLKSDEEDSKGLKELMTEKENKNLEKDKEIGKPKTALKSSEELKKFETAKNKEATESEIKMLTSKPDEEKSEHLKEEAIKRQIENMERIDKAGKPKAMH